MQPSCSEQERKKEKKQERGGKKSRLKCPDLGLFTCLTVAVVSPLWSVYRWWTAAREGQIGWGMMWNTWKLWPRTSAVTSKEPLKQTGHNQSVLSTKYNSKYRTKPDAWAYLGSNSSADRGCPAWAGKWATIPLPSWSSSWTQNYRQRREAIKTVKYRGSLHEPFLCNVTLPSKAKLKFART